MSGADWHASAKAAHSNSGGSGRTKYQKRLFLFRQQAGKCAICSNQMALHSKGGIEMATLDHITPRSMGGGSGLKNLRAVHKRCNEARGNSMTDIFVTVAGLVALRWNIKELP